MTFFLFFFYLKSTNSFIIPESPRWLLCKGRTAEVAAIIRRACVVNKREVPDNIDKLLKPPIKHSSEKGCTSLFRSRYLRLITLCFLCIWFIMNMVYYGLILNMNTFGGNVYLNSVSTYAIRFDSIWQTLRNCKWWHSMNTGGGYY